MISAHFASAAAAAAHAPPPPQAENIPIQASPQTGEGGAKHLSRTDAGPTTSRAGGVVAFSTLGLNARPAGDAPAGAPMLAALTERLAPLAEDTSWIGDDLYETDATQGFGISILHEEPDDGFLLETVCWEPGRGVAPHDHQTWGVVMGLTGEEINVDWRRVDDGAQPGRASLEQAGEIFADKQANAWTVSIMSKLR